MSIDLLKEALNANKREIAALRERVDVLEKDAANWRTDKVRLSEFADTSKKVVDAQLPKR